MTSDALGSTQTSHRPKGRLLWADAGKGACIVLVVLHHVIGKQYDFVVPAELSWLAVGWQGLTSGLKPLRMPLFFVLSGMFAAAALQRPWRAVLGSRVLSPYYLYVVWLCLHGVLFSVATELPMNRTRTFSELLADLVYASTSLWYLYALAAYFTLAKLLHRFDARLVVALAAAAVPLSSVLDIEAYNRESVLQHFVYFAFGAYFPTLVGRAAEVTRGRRTAACLAAYLVVGAVLLALDAPRGVLTLSLAVFAVPLGIGAAVAGCRAWPRAGQAVALVGRRTLPVYVLHVPILAGFHRLGLELPAPPGIPIASTLLAVVCPIIVTLPVIAACLLLHRLLDRGPLRWLFRRPSRG